MRGVGCEYIDLRKRNGEKESDVGGGGDDMMGVGDLRDMRGEGGIMVWCVNESWGWIIFYEGMKCLCVGGKEVMGVGFEKWRGEGYMNVYGDGYMGGKDERS